MRMRTQVFAGNRANEFEQRTAGTTYREIAASGGGIRATVRATRNASLSDLLKAGRRYAYWFLRCGTTTVEAKSGYGLTLEDELKILRAIKQLNEETPLNYVPTFLGAHDIPDEYKSRRETYLNLVINEMLPRVAEERLAEYCDVFCEEGVFTTDESWQILSAARCHGLGLRVHADQLSLSGGAKLAAELNAVTADHLEHTDLTGIAALKAANVQPVLLPGSVYALGSPRYPAARAMIDAGLAVVVATDFNPGSSPTPSMTMVLSLACTQMKMTPAEAITAATINAAYSLNRGDEIGSLERGKRADFVIHDASDYRELPYWFGVEHPWRVYVSGKLACQKPDRWEGKTDFHPLMTKQESTPSTSARITFTLLSATLCKPEFVMNSFKSCAARKLRETNQISGDVKPWDTSPDTFGQKSRFPKQLST
jgi:imidazolonepropionase